MKIRNIILGLGALVIIGIVGAAVFLASNLDAIVEAAIEKYGSEITGAPVTVSSVTLSPRSGEGTIRGLQVGNPQGFPSGDCFSLGQITVRIDITSLTKSPIVVQEVLIAAPVVNAVVNAQGKTNLDVIRGNAEHYSGTRSSGSSAEPSASESAPTLLRIEKFTFEDGTVAADLTAAGRGQFDTGLPAVRLNQVGGKNGATADVIGKQIVTAFTRNAVSALAQRGADQLIDENIGGAEGEAAKSLMRRFMKE